jgi:hypothetical protein
VRDAKIARRGLGIAHAAGSFRASPQPGILDYAGAPSPMGAQWEQSSQSAAMA